MILLALKVVAIIVCCIVALGAIAAGAYSMHVSEVEPERWSGQ
jgi:uncharacterized membrane protein YgdD (TMEM256/DUF423 family)